MMTKNSRFPIPILFTIPNFITAGSGQALLNVVQRLDRDRFKPSICVLKRGGRLETTIHELGIPLLELPFLVAPRPLPVLPVHLWQAARPFHSYGFALWHSYHYGDDYTEPLIAHLSGAQQWVYTKKNMNWGGRAWHLRSRFASRIAAQNNVMIARFFPQSTIKRKVRLLPRGINAEHFKPGIEPRLKLRQQLGINAQTLLVGCVANLLPIKGHLFLIRAIAKIPGVRLILAGKAMDEPFFAELKRLCTELGVSDRVHFLGTVEDVPAFNAELDIFVLASLGKGEACPVALLEAMACGVACIATNVPGSQDLIEDGKHGLLVPPEDDLALAAAINSLAQITDERQRLGRAARQRILDNYTIDREVAAHEALYAELLEV